MRVLFLSPLLLAVAPAVTVLAQEHAVTPLFVDSPIELELDGILSEPLWERAAVVQDLTVTSPVEGARPTYPTEILLAYDADALYVGIRCHDDPSQVRARQMDYDAFVRYDDVVELWFDTFHTQRFAFWFQITAGGSRGDALIADSGSSFNKSWDGIWYGRSQVDGEGWSAELRLPFKTLAFDPKEDAWGFNVRRERVANGESSRWASPFVAYDFFNLAEGGELRGMHGMRQGAGVDITPYLKSGITRDHTGSGGTSTDTDFDGGLDLSWRPTPASSVRVTTNTDFAETEVDERRANLTRFPLFFPEKRDFFLEDAGMFEFGLPGGRRGGGVRPFFSRTIGRAPDGTPVPILAGVKFTGRMGDWNLGLLETRVDDFETDDTGPVGERSLGVVRISRNFGGENSAGLILTHGDPVGSGSALTYGADFRLGSTRLFGEGRPGSLWGYYVATANEGAPDGANYGVRAQTSSSSWEHMAEVSVTEENYDPRMGFVRRTGVAHHRYRMEYIWRGGPEDRWRRYSFQIAPHVDLDLTGGEDRKTLPVTWAELEFQSEDSIELSTQWFRETLEDGFDLAEGVNVGPGDYDGMTTILGFQSNDRRRVTGEARLEVGDFFDGDLVRWSVEPNFIPSKFVSMGLGYEDIHAAFDGPDLSTQIYSMRLDFTFNPDLNLRNLVQYDSESADLGWQSRLHWILTPGQDLYVVALLGWNRLDRDSFYRTSEELSVKLAYTLRF